MSAALNLDHCPAEWRDGMALLERREPITGFADHRWDRLIASSRWFLDQWGGHARALGWTTFDLFGAHPAAPASRYDCAGLLINLGGATVQSLDVHGADLLSPAGFRLRHRRRLGRPPLGTVLLWEVGA